MRVYAYGGTSHEIRRASPGWPEPPRAQGETTGLARDRLSFGCVGFGGEPTLVVRQLQFVEGRPYPYFLLLQPPVAVWERFSENAALLLQALVDDNSCRESLFQHPEAIVESELADRLSQLTPIAPPKTAPDAAASEIWWGSAFAEQPAHLSPAEAGWSDLPTPAQMAAFLQQFPNSMRQARGWLIGGSPKLASALGAAFLLADDHAPGAGLDEATLRQVGRDVSTCWAQLVATGQFGQSLADCDREPPWRWPQLWGLSPVAMADRMRMLCHGLSPGALTPEWRASMITGTDTSPFACDLRERSRHDLLNRSDGLTPPDLEFLFALLAGAPAAISAADFQLLSSANQGKLFKLLHDKGALDAALITRGGGAHLWTNLFEQLPPADVPRYLPPALLAEADGSLTSADVDWLLEIALEATRPDRLVWLNSQTDAAVWSRLEGPLREVVRRDCLEVTGATTGMVWPYLAFGADPGGRWLAGAAGPAICGAIFDALRDEAACKAHLRTYRADWLAAAATSPLRDQLGLPDKLALAKAGVPGWNWLADLERLVVGEAVRDLREAPPDEQSRLVGELRELLRSSAVAALPDPGALGLLLGASLPDDLRRELDRAPILAIRRAVDGLSSGAVPVDDMPALLYRAVALSELGTTLRQALLDAAADSQRAGPLIERLQSDRMAFESILRFLDDEGLDEFCRRLARADGRALRNVAAKAGRAPGGPLSPRLAAAIDRALGSTVPQDKQGWVSGLCRIIDKLNPLGPLKREADTDKDKDKDDRKF
jgi:hypothetical protein